MARTESSLDARPRSSTLRLLARQFVSPIEIVLVVATVLAGILGDATDAIIILVILLASGLLGFVQERGADRAIQALLATVEVSCRVRRSGQTLTIPLSQAIPGDIAMVAAGDLVPGDGRVLTANALSVDESALTGESFPVDKTAENGSDSVFLGTHVVSGTGELLVERVGRATRIGQAAEALSERRAPTGFEHGMTRFGLLLTRAMVVLVVIIFVVNLALQRPPLDAALFSLALAVGLTPQLLPAIVAIGLARGARSLARQRVIVRRLDAIEDIGAMSILCADKTGTMTTGRIRLERALAPDGSDDADVARLASLNAGLQTGMSNPIDDAILADYPVPRDARALGEVPYDFTRRRLSVLTLVADDDEPTLITKGALEPVLAVCDRAAAPAGSSGTVPIEAVLPAVSDAFATLSADGFRVLGVATRLLARDAVPRVENETDMVFRGLLAFADPVKSDAARTIADLAAAGVSIRMVTGDNALVAARIAEEVGLDPAALCRGADIDRWSDDAIAAAVGTRHVFCEVTPVQKERIILAFRRAGHVVGYLGDGINDAPPLHSADVGITVDTAVPVAKQAAAVVLLDKDLGVILDGVMQGRRTFANTMKYIVVNTSASFGNMLSMAVAAAILPFLPLLAGQILLLNLLSDLPAMTIATDSVDDDMLRRPQQWDLRLIRSSMIVFGLLSSVFDLVTFGILRVVFHAGATEFRSAWLIGSILTEVGVLFVLRTRGPLWRSRPSRWLVLASAMVVVVTVWLPFSPAAAPLGLVAVPLALLGAVAAITLLYLAANELVKRVFWARRSRPRVPRRVQRPRPAHAPARPR